MDTPQEQVGRQRPALPTVPATPPQPPLAGRDVVLGVRATPPDATPLDRSNAELAEALAIFQRGLDPRAPW